MQIRKPSHWTSFDDLLACEAGQAYVADQIGGYTCDSTEFRSTRPGHDPYSYELFEDRSVWFHSNADDEVWEDVMDFIQSMHFDGIDWNELDSCDQELLTHCFGEDEVKEWFLSQGGIVAI